MLSEGDTYSFSEIAVNELSLYIFSTKYFFYDNIENILLNEFHNSQKIYALKLNIIPDQLMWC